MAGPILSGGKCDGPLPSGPVSPIPLIAIYAGPVSSGPYVMVVNLSAADLTLRALALRSTFEMAT